MKELKVNVNDNEIIELMKLFKTNDENEAIKMAIDEVLKKQIYSQLLALKGKVAWEGNLEEMRLDRI